MAYQKQTWRDYDDNKTEVVNMNQGAVVTPERLNHMETGIANSADKAEVTAQLQQTEKQVGKNPADFGALGNGVQDDTLFIQSMIDSLYQESTQNGGYVYTGFSEEVKFPAGDYLISDTITIPQAYPNIDFSGSRFRPHPNALNDFFAFNFTAIWNGSFKNLVLDGFKKNIKMYNNNQDSGNIKIDNVSFYGGDIGYDIECQSSKVTLTNFKFNRVKKPVISRRCDKLTLSHGWHDAGVLDTIYDGMYEISNATQLIIDDMLYVPRPQTIDARKIFVVKLIGGSVLIKNSLFGGEPGQIPLVGVIGGSLTGRGNRVSIQDTMAFTSSSALVELFNIPNYVEFSGVTGGLEATNEAMMIRLNSDLVSYADAVLQADPESKIVFGRNYQSLPFSSASSNLLPFIVGANNTRFNKVVATNLIGAEVLFDSKRNSKNAFVFRRGAVYKLSISNRTNPTVENFSQFLIQANFGGENATIKTLIQGANTTAPKAVVEDGVVKIYTNGAVAENSFYYKLEIADVPVFPFHH